MNAGESTSMAINIMVITEEITVEEVMIITIIREIIITGMKKT